MGSIKMAGVKVAYPEKESFKSLALLFGRVGSLGGEILKRFTVIFDYKNKVLDLKPTSAIDAPFYYNMSGIEIQYSGVRLVREKITNVMGLLWSDEKNSSKIEVFKQPQYRLEFQQLIEVFEIRKGSPAAEAGMLEGDILLRINGRKISQLKLHEIINYHQKKTGQKLQLHSKELRK